MHAIILAGSLFATGISAVPAASPKCNQDNCFRAVDAAAFPTRKTRQDCSSFLLTTVTPATTTFTASATTTQTTVIETQTTTFSPVVVIVPSTIPITQTISVGFSPLKRDVLGLAERAKDILPQPRYPEVTPAVEKRQMTKSPSGIPNYATSACLSSSAYASACSCIGVTRSTTTVAAPSTTSTQTAMITATATSIITITLPSTTFTTVPTTITVSTVTVSPTPACPAVSPTFYLQAGNTERNGQFAQVVSANNRGDNAIVFGPQSLASTFTINAAGQLGSGANFANTDGGSTISFFYFDTPATIASQGFTYATCSLAGNVAAPVLQCAAGVATTFRYCGDTQFAGSGVALTEPAYAGCLPLTLNVICVT